MENEQITEVSVTTRDAAGKPYTITVPVLSSTHAAQFIAAMTASHNWVGINVPVKSVSIVFGEFDEDEEAEDLTERYLELKERTDKMTPEEKFEAFTQGNLLEEDGGYGTFGGFPG